MSNTFYKKKAPCRWLRHGACLRLYGLTVLLDGAVDGHAPVGLQHQIAPVHQVLHKEPDVPLKPQGPGGLVGEQLEVAAHRPGDLADVHGFGDQGQDLSRPLLGQRLVVVDERLQLLPAAHPRWAMTKKSASTSRSFSRLSMPIWWDRQ